MEFGLMQGLAVRNSRDKEIEDLKYLDGLRKQNEAMLMAKQKMFMEDFEFLNGSNKYDDGIIRQEAEAAMKALSELRRAHPHDFYTNPDIQFEAKRIKNGLKGSEANLRSIAYKEALAQQNKFMELAYKNPSKYNMDQLQAFQEKVRNYGNPESMQQRGITKEEPLAFTPPEEIPDFDKLYMETGNSMDPDLYTTIKNGRDGAYRGDVSDEALTKKAVELYDRHKSAFDYVYKETPDKIAAIKNSINPFTKKVYNIGERNNLADQMALARFKKGLESTPQGVSPYDVHILNSAKANPGAEFLAETFSNSVPNFYTDAKGNVVQNKDDFFFYDGDIYDENYNEKGYKKTGVKDAPGYFDKSLEWAKDNGYLYDPIGPSGQQGTDYELLPGQKGKGKIVEVLDKEGKGHLVFRVNSVAKINANEPSYRHRFDSNVAKLTGKQKESTGLSESSLKSPEVIRINKSTGKRYRQVPGGWEELD